MLRDLTPLFFPESVAVIGASARPTSLAGAVLRNLVAGGYPGTLAAVNPAIWDPDRGELRLVDCRWTRRPRGR
jgi:acetyltransferase